LAIRLSKVFSRLPMHHKVVGVEARRLLTRPGGFVQHAPESGDGGVALRGFPVIGHNAA